MSSPSPARIPGLDGLRGLAVLLVVVGHAVPTWWPLSYMGVTIFFVLSGYLITNILVSGVSGRFGLRRFYIKRFFRLAPTLLLVLAAVLVWSWVRGTAAEDNVFWSALLTVTYSANFGVVRGGFALMLEHTWSLAVEEQFYAIWPLLILAVRVVPRRVIAVAGVGAAVALAYKLAMVCSGDYESLAYGTLSVAFALFAGALAAMLTRRARPSVVVQRVLAQAGILVLLVSGFVGVWAALSLTFPLDVTPYAVGLAAGQVVVAVAAALIVPWTETIEFLGWRTFVWFGGISYALYLWQTPIEYNGLGDGYLHAIPPWLMICIAVPLAWVTTTWFERPLTAYGHTLAWDRYPATEPATETATEPATELEAEPEPGT